MNLKIEKLSKKYVEEVAKLESDLISSISNSSVEKTIDNNTISYFVLLDNEIVIGFLQGQIISPEAEIFEIAIAENFQGRGYSKLLIDFFIDLAKKNFCETIFLEVNSINMKAQNLYKKYGFCEYGIRKKYYGINDAILMKLKI